MRVLQLHTRYRDSGGEDRVVDSEAGLLEEAGHEVYQLIERNPPGDFQAAIDLALSLWNPAPYRQTREAVAAFKPDVAHVHNTWFSMSPSVIAALRADGVPIVMTLHNYRLTCANGLLYRDGKVCELCVGGHSLHAVRYGCYRSSRIQSVPPALTSEFHRRLGTWTKHVGQFIALTGHQRELMIRAGLPGFRIATRPHRVPDPGARPQPPSRSRYVLFVGRLAEEKGVKSILDAWSIMGNARPDLLVAGDGPERHLMTNLPRGVSYLGRQTPKRIRELMLGARALVMPSLWQETMGLVVLEAFAAGLPVLASDLGAPAEIVAAALGDDWVVPAGDGQSIGEAILRLNDDSCDRAGHMARRAYEARYSMDTAAESLVDVYRRTIAMGSSNG